MSASFAQNCSINFSPEPEESVMKTLFSQYEKVIVETIITTFALDFMFTDRHGGDVDTIHNVRQIGNDDGLMVYKNPKNAEAYRNHEKNDKYTKATKAQYDSDNAFININRQYSAQKKEGNLVDAYTGNKVAKNADIDLDHVISTKEIHDDRGRVLAGLDGKTLANSPENLQPTDRSINRSMKEKSIDEYTKWLKEKEPERNNRIAQLKGKPTLTDKERSELNKLEKQNQIDIEKMKEADKKARQSYEAKLNTAYYTSPQFRHDMVCAAANTGVKMGMRQAFGYVFMEVWFAVKERFAKLAEPFDLSKALTAVADGVKHGIESAIKKYKELFSKFGEGVLSGILSSISTTICNIFFTTAKNTVKLIRRTYVSLVQAAKVLFLNPDNYLFGDRIREVAKLIATGASVAVGTILSDQIGKIADKIPVEAVAEVLPEFCGALTTGLMTCTLLFYFDRSEMINKLVSKLNDIPTISTEVNYFREQAIYFEMYAAELMKIDLETFKRETQMYSSFCNKLEEIDSPTELNVYLKDFYNKLDWKLPWQGDFDTFMSNKSNVLRFE